MTSREYRDLEFDVCVIGSGPAGIITTLEFARQNPDRSILLIEYGNGSQKTKNALDEKIKISNPANHHDPYECTNKGLGGTSQTWGGRCVMYDEIDFTYRPIISGDCTWNISTYNEILKYLATSAEYFECGAPIFDLNKLPVHFQKSIAEGFIEGDITSTCLERWSMPTRFGRRYLKELKSRKNIWLLLGYEARDFKMKTTFDKALRLDVRSIMDGSILSINAKRYVIAAGAQETTRILLRNPQLFSAIGGVPKSLGKYYQGHVSGKIATIKFNGNPKLTDYSFIRDSEGIYLRRRFQFTKEILLERNLLNTAIWLDNPLYHDPKHRNGTMSLIYLLLLFPPLRKRLAPPAIASSVTGNRSTSIPLHVKNIIQDFPMAFVSTFWIFLRRYLIKRKLPGVFLYSPNNFYALHYHAEQLPMESNRMELGEDGETLNIHYTLSDLDINSVIEVHRILDDWLQRNNCGRLEYWYAEKDLPEVIRQNSKDGIHQSGTTRMADSADMGVVDHNLRLFGPDNVFICSSSVFPTSGQANPTFLLGAFAARLAHHLTYSN